MISLLASLVTVSRQHAVVPVFEPVAVAARDRCEAVALEAGQAGFAICVTVTVAHAHVAFASATPVSIVSTGRELWQHALPRAHPAIEVPPGGLCDSIVISLA